MREKKTEEDNYIQDMRKCKIPPEVETRVYRTTFHILATFLACLVTK